MRGWAWLAVPLVVLALVVVDRWLVHRPVRAARRRRPPGRRASAGGVGAFGDLIALFQPGARHQHEEAERRRHDLVTPGVPDQGWAIDLDAGTAVLPGPPARPESGVGPMSPAAPADPLPRHDCLLRSAAAGVWTMTAETWSSVTTVVVAADGTCLVVDPNIWPADLTSLVSELQTHGWTPVAGFSTHPHWDHVLWPAPWAGVPRWATPRAAGAAAARRRELEAEADEVTPGHDHRCTALLTGLAGDHIPWEGPPAVVLPYRGHCPGSAALWLPDAAVLVSGDMLSDVEIPLLADPSAEDPDPVVAYRASLDGLATIPVLVLVPGHGTVTDRSGMLARLAADRAYLDLLGATDGARPSEQDPAAQDRRLADPEQAEHHAGQLALVASLRDNE